MAAKPTQKAVPKAKKQDLEQKGKRANQKKKKKTNQGSSSNAKFTTKSRLRSKKK